MCLVVKWCDEQCFSSKLYKYIYIFDTDKKLDTDKKMYSLNAIVSRFG